MSQVCLITGASSGIGAATARALLHQGWTIYGAARRQEPMAELAKLGLRPVSLDVTSPDSCAACVGKIIEEVGRIDALINNAGYGSYGAFEEVSNEEAHNQFEVNVFGLASMTREVLPFMRQQQSGRIINISSMGGQIYTPMGSWYYASKRAVEALSDSLRHEVAPYGIKVVLIEPGVIRSEWSDIAINKMQQTSAQGPYAKICAKMSKVLKLNYSDALVGSPDYIANLIVKALSARSPQLRYAGPLDAKVLLFFKKYAPDWLFDAIVGMICA
ncbi:MAG: oxidoreductase [Candidatus Bruticola sp.]